MSGKLLLIYICNFHVLSHLLLIHICKLHWNLRYQLRTEGEKLISQETLVNLRELITILRKKREVLEFDEDYVADKIVQGKSLLIYICNFHVLSNLLLIYICKLHWNLNTMFVCQVNPF